VRPGAVETVQTGDGGCVSLFRLLIFVYLSTWHSTGNRPVVHSAILAERPETLVIILMTRPLMTKPLSSALKFGA